MAGFYDYFSSFFPYFFRPPVDEYGRNILHWAIIRNQPETVEALIQQNPKLIDYDSRNNSVVHYAAAYGHTRILEYLWSVRKNNFKINANDINSNNDTALHLAIRNKHTDAAKVLIMAGAALTGLNSWYQTPIDLAWQSGNMEVVKLLMIKSGRHIQHRVSDFIFTFIEKMTNKWFFDLSQLRGHDLKVFTEILHDILLPPPPNQPVVFPYLKCYLGEDIIYKLLRQEFILRMDDPDILLERLKHEENTHPRKILATKLVIQFGIFALPSTRVAEHTVSPAAGVRVLP